MSFQLGNRDEHGVLVGSFDIGRGSFPIDVLRRFVPFLYPCGECQRLRLHVVGEQHAGMSIGIVFMKRPLASTKKTLTAICNTCTNISTTLPRDVAAKLEQGIIPPQIASMYAAVCAPPEPYTEGFVEHLIAQSEGAPSKALDHLKTCLYYYRREHA